MSISMEEALGITEPETEKGKTSQNITFNATELSDIEKIKGYLSQRMTQVEIAEQLNCARETVSRKIGKWMLTDDFKEWLNAHWLDLLNSVSKTPESEVEGLRQLTRYMCTIATRKIEAKSEVTEKVTIDVDEKLSILRRYEAVLKKRRFRLGSGT